jgi:hypothetical protein
MIEEITNEKRVMNIRKEDYFQRINLAQTQSELDAARQDKSEAFIDLQMKYTGLGNAIKIGVLDILTNNNYAGREPLPRTRISGNIGKVDIALSLLPDVFFEKSKNGELMGVGGKMTPVQADLLRQIVEDEIGALRLTNPQLRDYKQKTEGLEVNFDRVRKSIVTDILNTGLNNEPYQFPQTAAPVNQS